MPTHKKGHDKDKYYFLAKDQGYRSRAAFKLIQINKRFEFLSKAKVLIDLCAAPGGWCQVAAKYMPTGSLIVGVDLLPIRSIRNVKTFVSDITTAECRRTIVSELQGWKADVVLCDGAPNIGSAYSKDAYIQNELVIAALKTATDHLVQGGTFCTKVYRSVDYNAILWVLQQLFEDVQTMKPNSSRSQSSEIFIVCLKYTAPNYIDPKLLDPNHVFKEVADPGLKKVNVLHKKYEQSNKRQRSGYDESLGMTLRSTASVSDFFAAKEPVQLLTDVNALVFTDSESCQKIKQHARTTDEMITCVADLKLLGKTDFKKILKWRTQIRKDQAAEQRALKKASGETMDEEDEEGDDNGLKRIEPALLSEDAIQDEIANLQDMAMQSERRDKKKARRLTSKERQRQYLGMSGSGFDVGEDMELFAIHDSTTRQQLEDMGDVNLEDIDEDVLFPTTAEEEEEVEEKEDAGNKPFKGKMKGQRANRGSIIEVIEDDLEDELELAYQRFLIGRKAKSVSEEKEGRFNQDGFHVDANGENISASSKRSRAAMQSDAKLARLAEEDASLRATADARANSKRKGGSANVYSEDLEAYVGLLTKSTKKAVKRDGRGNEIIDATTSTGDAAAGDDFDEDERDNSDDSSEDDGFSDNNSNDDDEEDEDCSNDDSQSDTMASQRKPKGRTTAAAVATEKVVSRDGLSKAGKAAKWFANPIFSSSLVGSSETTTADGSSNKDEKQQQLENNTSNSKRKKNKKELDADNDVEMETETITNNNKKNSAASASSSGNKKRTRQEIREYKEQQQQQQESGYDTMMQLMPLTDKQVRKEQRKKDAERRERKTAKAQRILHEGDEEELPGGATSDLIKRGVGKNGILLANSSAGAGFEIVPAESETTAIGDALQENNTLLPGRTDDRIYDSDHEEYDVHDRTRTLALGTMMLRHSKKKALVDASYNRFAWNDPSGLPSWFMDDEMRHNKPQLPIPTALLEQIKSRFQKTGTKEIKKVAEARMRKRKRATAKLNAAKKQANIMAESNEISERQKLKAINKAMRSNKIEKPGKVYVVTRKTKQGSMGSASGGGKGKLKFVDKRMKNDVRALKRAAKKKTGKKRK